MQASFVLTELDSRQVNVSARSLGEINVQLIMERIGGGGRFDAAAAELKTAALTETLTRLKEAIDGYEEELKQAAEKEKETAAKGNETAQ